MFEILFLMILGHFVGDFLFQHKIMADNKRSEGFMGWLWCFLHVLIYSLVVCVFVWNFSLLFFVGVFVPHWFIDRWSLAYKWMQLTGASEKMTSRNIKDVAFGVAVYVVIDQIMHIGSLYLLFKFIY